MGILGAVGTTGIGLEVTGGLVLAVFIAIEFATTGGFFGGTSKNKKIIIHYYVYGEKMFKKLTQ